MELTDTVSSICQVRRNSDPPLLSCAQALQGFVHPLDHVSHADVSVVGAVSLVADRETQE